MLSMASVLAAISLLLVQVTATLLTRLSLLRKSKPSSPLGPIESRADVDHSEAQQAQANKQIVNTASSRATWPMQGGLASVTNTASTCTQTAVPAQNTAVVKTEPALPLQEARQAKTPSPKKGPAAPGKENISTTPQSAE